ncbi:MAG: hypothetical protein A2845_02610 [Candidatus Lloydbacteria bacterium RIFCSPHIGHO2_01_FULL_49_22]|uniref:histidine kinase n=1 Tax=Candidatus Lloydbacteria bacterium RIFCSPHIGHO2_01_FULL_49_22 TaxID=1798658 RepID=A0A1G2CXE8_9BACT|nr:MAG: hypothetical protein A2845_02610 [Candidatus Lloydbacteria bacterium RIFCSPHIGHO2_01_FULL_49_22]OGZ10340.1 MAG: hypothetical protein A3C14_02310 [Candidatus Lloydbacteria bacterium RIFCSPHIGHO2_02_FULL_50_18]
MDKIKHTITAFIQYVRRNIFSFAVLLFVPLWYFLVAPYLLMIPSDFTYKADMVSVDNFYDASIGEFGAEQYSKTDFSYEVVSYAGFIFTIKNIFHVASLDGKTIFRAEPLYGINALNGQHVRGAGDRDRDGYLFAPRWLKGGSSFTYWHASNNTPSQMKYVGEETLYGLKVFKYQKSNIEPTDQTELMGFLPGVPETRGVKLSSDLFMWIEPISGHVVKMEDFSIDYFYFDIKTGERSLPYNQFLNTYTDESVRAHVQMAEQERNKIIFFQFGVPFLLLLLVLFMLMYIRQVTMVKNFWRENWIALIIFIVSIAITFVVYYLFEANAEKEKQSHFATEVAEISANIQKQMEIYVNTLRGTGGLFAASQTVSRDEWRAYLTAIKVFKNYPGIQGLGFAQIVSSDEKDAFIASMRKEGLPDFVITPEGERSAYTPILYVEPPTEMDRRSIGFDMSTEKTRRSAMASASASGEASISGRVMLMQQEGAGMKAGFVAYAPVHWGDVASGSVSRQPESVFGYVFSVIDAAELVRGSQAFKSADITFRIYDGLRMLPERLMFDASEGVEGWASDLTFRTTVTMYVADHPWTIEFTNAPLLPNGRTYAVLRYLIVVVGLLMSFALFGVIYVTARSKKQAIAYAENANSDLVTNIAELENTKKAVLNILDDVESEKENLAKVSRRLALATESAQIGVWEWDITKDKISWNDQMYALYAMSKEESERTFEAWQKRLHPDDKKLRDDAIQAALRGEKEFNMQFRIIWPSGETHYIQDHALVERDGDGKAIKMVGVNWDITKESIVDREKTEFVSLASHQLKTPVGAIQWNLEMLLDGDYGEMPDNQKEILRETYSLNTRINELIHALLNVSRIEMGVFIVEPTPTDFVAVCNEVLKEMEGRIAQKGHQMITHFDAQLPIIPADAKLLRVVFQNFISNAVKYTQDNGRITVVLHADGGNVIFSVSNNGEPIPEGEQSQIFQKMFRASNAQKQDVDGTGLGLYVVKQIVENAGGKIWFTSKVGEDTVFACLFPLSGMIAKRGTKKLD